MPSLKAALFEELTGDATVSGLVGTKVFPDYADQQTALPYITYEEFANRGVHHFGGVTDLDNASYQFSIFSNDQDNRLAIENAVRALFDGEARVYGTGGDATSVTRSENTNNQDFVIKPDDAGQGVVFQAAMDFEFWHKR